jgi:hypothetical protein
MKRGRAKSRKPATSAASRIFPYWQYALVFLIILLFAGIRFRLRDFPLERDEGEYAYMGQLLLQGIPPYQLAYNMKLPGTYASYAAILAVFGQTPAGIHIGLLLINAATTFLVFWLAKRLFGDLAGVVACACYAFLSASPSVMGFSAHATHFVVLPAVAGILLMLRALETRRTWMFFASGFLTGLACIMKQPGVFFILFAGAYQFYAVRRENPVDKKGLAAKTAAYSLGAVTPFALTCLLLLWAGVFDRFWFWTFTYAREYGTQNSLSMGLAYLGFSIPGVIGASFPLWLIAAVGLTSFLWHSEARSRTWFVGGFLLFSFLAVCPGLFFRAHYYVLMLPAVAIAAGLAVKAATDLFDAKDSSLAMVPVLVFLLALGYSMMQDGRYFFVLSPAEASRATYGDGLFQRTLEIGRYLDGHAAPDAKIAVLGSEPQIYFYSRRHSATGYIYMYGLMEVHPYALTMQREMMGEIETARPEFLVFVPHPSSWTRKVESETAILTWADKYVRDHYVLEGIADVVDTGAPILWGDEARTNRPRTETIVKVFKRKN